MTTVTAEMTDVQNVTLVPANLAEMAVLIIEIGNAMFRRRSHERDNAIQGFLLYLTRKVRDLGKFEIPNFEKNVRAAIKRRYFNELRSIHRMRIEHSREAVDVFESARSVSGGMSADKLLKMQFWKFDTQQQEFIDLLLGGYDAEQIMEIKCVSRATYFRILSGIRETLFE